MAWQPRPLAINEWGSWEQLMKTTNPIRFFFQETLPTKIHLAFYDRGWYRNIRDAYWWIAHRWVPEHQYNTIRPRTLKPGYYDPREQILHATMECFSQFVERGAQNIDWAYDEEHQHVHKEMMEIYKWWTEQWPLRETIDVNGNPLEPFPDTSWEAWDTETMRIASHYNDNDEAWLQKENEMLARVIMIRRHLWFV